MFKLLVLIQALLIQVITGQCTCNDNIPNWAGVVSPAAPGSWCGVQPANIPYNQYSIDVASLSPSGYGLPVTSSSPIAPGVLSITSENVIEGPISVYGQLPFLSAVSFEGSMPTQGYGSVAYGCGNGNIGIMSETSGSELGYDLSPVRSYGTPSFGGLGGLGFAGRQGMEIPSVGQGCGRAVGSFTPARACGCQ